MRNIEQCFPLQKPSIEDSVKINQIKNYLNIAQWYLKLPKHETHAINEGDLKYSKWLQLKQTLDDCLKCNPVYPNVI